MKHYLKFVLIAISLISSSLAHAGPEQELLTLLDGMSTYQANFWQVVRSGKKIIQDNHGQLAIARPGKFRWQVTKPANQLIVMQNQQAWVFDQDLAQVTKRTIDPKKETNPANLLSGEGAKLLKYFRIEKQAKPPYVDYVLKPKHPGQPYQYILFRFNNQRVLVGMVFVDYLGNSTDLRLSQIKVNQPISAAVFQFKPPAGVDVLTGE